MFLTLVVIIASLSPNPLEMAGRYPRPFLTLVVLLAIVILHLFSISHPLPELSEPESLPLPQISFLSLTPTFRSTPFKPQNFL